MTRFGELLGLELQRARRAHPTAINSPHEAVSVIEEEFLEFKAVVYSKRRDVEARQAMLRELVHTAAMCRRAAEDLRLTVREPEPRPRRQDQ